MAKPRSITLTPGLNVHHLVAKTATGLANEWFEVYARENDYYRRLRANGEVTEQQAREFFVRRVTPKLYEDARQALAATLALPDDQVSPHMKDEITEALILDNELRANRFVANSVAHTPSRLH